MVEERPNAGEFLSFAVQLVDFHHKHDGDQTAEEALARHQARNRLYATIFQSKSYNDFQSQCASYILEQTGINVWLEVPTESMICD